MISAISFVISACRARLYWRVSRFTMSEALSEASFMASRRATCSDATASASTE